MREYILLFCIIFTERLIAQIQPDTVFKHTLHTIQVYKNDNQLDYPIIMLHSDDYITVRFDEISEKKNLYCYTLEYCDRNWQKSSLQSLQYISGFEYNDIISFRLSENTFTDYVHYQFSFPNNDIRILLPGNYLIKVFEREGDKKHLVFQKRCMVYNPLIHVNGTVKQPTVVEYKKKYQELSVQLDVKNVRIRDYNTDLTVKIFQNGRPDKVLADIKPTFVNNSVYEFNS
ncbi:MAG: type IX secretion system plug protein domain-containing protein, partial [Bacteroidales bacterium]